MNSTFWSLDTETTGFDPKAGHKVIEVGATEIVNGQPSGRVFHVYIDPEREIPEEAVRVHNMTREDCVDLGNGKVFKDIADDLLLTLKDSVIVAHNASFDMDFLDYELEQLGHPKLTDTCSMVIDSLHYAQTVHPSKKNNLDALAKRYGIDNSDRDYHGALLDANILAKVFVAMTNAQKHISLNEVEKSMQSKRTAFKLDDVIKPINSTISKKLKTLTVPDDVIKEHESYMDGMAP